MPDPNDPSPVVITIEIQGMRSFLHCNTPRLVILLPFLNLKAADNAIVTIYKGNFRGWRRGNWYERGINSCNGGAFVRGYPVQSESILSISHIACISRVSVNVA